MTSSTAEKTVPSLPPVTSRAPRAMTIDSLGYEAASKGIFNSNFFPSS